MSSRHLVRQGSERLGARGNAEEPPSPVAVAQCTLLIQLVVGAVWFGLWADYDYAENCDKKLQLWYDLIMGGVLFSLVCDVGVVIAARKESKPALKLCNVLMKLDQLFECGVMLWGVDLAYGKKSHRVGAGGCKVLATFQKVNSLMTISFLGFSLMAIMNGGGEDAEKAEEMYVGAEMTKRMRAQKGHDSREPERARQDLEAPTPRSGGTA